MLDFGPEAIKTLLYTALASGGGLLGYLMRTLEDENEKIHWGKAFVQAAGSGFTGFLVLMLCQAMGLGDLWTGAIVGLFGWMGATATIVVLEKVIYSKLGVTKDDSGKD